VTIATSSSSRVRKRYKTARLAVICKHCVTLACVCISYKLSAQTNILLTSIINVQLVNDSFVSSTENDHQLLDGYGSVSVSRSGYRPGPPQNPLPSRLQCSSGGSRHNGTGGRHVLLLEKRMDISDSLPQIYSFCKPKPTQMFNTRPWYVKYFLHKYIFLNCNNITTVQSKT